MRFTRYARYEDFDWTPRKLAMARSKPDRQQKKVEERFPLLASILPPPAAFDEEAERARRRERLRKTEIDQRARLARLWRACRRDFFAASEEQKDLIRQAWATWAGPTTGLYYRYVVDLHTGIVDARSAAFRQQEQQRLNDLLQRARAQGSLDL